MATEIDVANSTLRHWEKVNSYQLQ
ncbi:hypothetical protein LG329_14315 [Virgibacillus necropolis]